MSDDDEFSRVAEIERAANGKASYLDMDAAFCARMYAAITAGLESAPTRCAVLMPWRACRRPSTCAAGFSSRASACQEKKPDGDVCRSQSPLTFSGKRKLPADIEERRQAMDRLMPATTG